MQKTKEQIRYNMQQVKSKNSKIELLLRKELWSRGLRYRKNAAHIYGKPDIAFIGKKSLFFATANFGTDIIGKNGKKTSNPTEAFGLLKLSETWRAISK